MVEDMKKKRHEVVLVNREKLEISGVIQVESFDSEEFILETEKGFLAIRGINLHMKHLNLEQGMVSIQGTVYDIGYLDEGYSSEKAKGFFSRLFK
ncbi:sporulation protein YabP [Microaerobacter geothermalis]|uniref:sporulation protein YabP n=1 Tax=Microaerobacter geothermalis TaxID=674972 RepID=UPI001F27B8EE|nr:sporulation protein YabP [Microaerobacter geothermalis]MCF6094691.1 sporulation protein YabP [Microaerobacter geothermalis]